MAEWKTESVRRIVTLRVSEGTPQAFWANALLDAEEKFDAWLAAHDAEVRAQALRDVRDWLGEGLQSIGGLTTVEQAWRALADPANPPFGCAQAEGGGR